MIASSHRLIDKKIAEIEDREILNLLAELSHTTSSQPDSDLTLLNYLNLCLYRGGLGKRSQIRKNELVNPIGLLTQKVKRFAGGSVFRICGELAATRSQTEELWLETPLYLFFNKVLLNHTKPKRATKKAPRKNLGGGWIRIPAN